MAAEYWTQCRQPSEADSNGELFWVKDVLLGLLAGAGAGFLGFLGGSIPVAWIVGGLVADGLITAAVGSIVVGAFAWGIIAAGALYGAVDALCKALLSKTVCLGGVLCAMGRVISATRKSPFLIDNDKTFNLFLAPHADPVSDATLFADGLQGTLVAQHPATNHLGFTGYSDRTPNGSAVLHCEIEGAGYHNHCIGFKVAAIATGIAIGICIAYPPACAIALLVALAILILAYLLSSLFTDNPDYDDAAVNSESGNVESADPATGAGGDCVVVTGRWVYDMAHDGWNELHPLLTLQKVPADQCVADGDIAAFRPMLERWCEMTGRSRDPLVQEEQKKARQQWLVDPRLG